MRDAYIVGLVILVVSLAAAGLFFPDALSALLLVLVFSTVALIAIRYNAEEKDFLTGLFLAGLLLRLTVGLFIEIFELRDFFGGDAVGYHLKGGMIVDGWNGLLPADHLELRRATSIQSAGWGMNYFVAFIYVLVGPSILAAQSLCAVVGAGTAPLVFLLTKRIFLNKSVARASAIAIAVFPSFVLWSAQLLKDGLIIFLLVLAILMVTKLQEKFSYASLAVLIFSLFGILSLRFYIFYMVALAVTGGLLIGVTGTGVSIFRRAALLVVMGLGLTYFGIIQNASSDIEQYGRLERVQMSRLDLSRAESGYGEDIDISTTEGAISAIPIGFAYLMLAPFPWQVSNLRQAITVPEVLIWWSMIPMMIAGIWYAIKNRLRSAFPILFFSLMLTLAYSIFQGNVGTAYRQRTQIQVFLFIFIAVGWGLWKEKRDDRKMARLTKQKKFDDRLRGHHDDDDHRGYA